MGEARIGADQAGGPERPGAGIARHPGSTMNQRPSSRTAFPNPCPGLADFLRGSSAAFGVRSGSLPPRAA